METPMPSGLALAELRSEGGTGPEGYLLIRTTGPFAAAALFLDRSRVPASAAQAWLLEGQREHPLGPLFAMPDSGTLESFPFRSQLLEQADRVRVSAPPWGSFEGSLVRVVGPASVPGFRLYPEPAVPVMAPTEPVTAPAEPTPAPTQPPAPATTPAVVTHKHIRLQPAHALAERASGAAAPSPDGSLSLHLRGLPSPTRFLPAGGAGPLPTTYSAWLLHSPSGRNQGLGELTRGWGGSYLLRTPPVQTMGYDLLVITAGREPGSTPAMTGKLAVK